MSLEELTANLLEASHNDNTEDLLVLLQQMQEAACLPGDKSCLIGPVVKLLPSHNLDVKRRIYATLQKLCEENPDAALLAANCVIRDCRDPNPEVKCLGVWGVSVLPPLLPLYAADILAVALGDPHPRVRRTAVSACGKVFSTAPGLLEEKGFVNRLYESIRDEDTLVVVQSLLVLDRALAPEGGVVVNRKLAQYLLLRLPHFQPPQLATILQVLRKYTPKTDQELFTQLSLLDPYLANKDSAAVVVNCAQLFVQLIEPGYPHLEKDVIVRCVPALTTFLDSPDTHAQGYVLEFLQWTENRKTDWLANFSKSWHLFCPEKKGSGFKTRNSPSDVLSNHSLLQNKLLLLPRVCSVENASEVLRTLEEAAWDRSNDILCRAHLDCIISLVERLPQPASSQALRLLIRFIGSRETVIVVNALQALERLDVKKLPSDEISPLLVAIVTSMDICKEVSIENDMEDVFATPAILPELLFERRDVMSPQSVVHVMQALVTLLPQIIQCHAYTFASQILQSCIRLFLKEPASFQLIFGRALHICVECAKVGDSKTSPGHYLAVQQLGNEALWYYNLLKCDSSAAIAKKVLCI
ncbi:AP-4 complex subunit beta-1-like [Frankliniella occidentalis]|uniref:AP-4 complex subunit beta-1-like n=1 Tax=Frankliniella occidentalis TaxID=133901 RepID=A0A6J1RWM2_FRAOC|nr:AP-4 complex subunit beta-1-like [Frankliniella occidentalis]